MPRRGRLSAETTEAILADLDGGQTQTDIAAKYNVSQPCVSLIQKRAAFNGVNGHKNDRPVPGTTGTRAFVQKAWMSSFDAGSWGDVGKQAIERQMAIDAAEMVSAAWKEAANKLRKA